MSESDYIDVLDKPFIYTVRLVIYANSLLGCGMHISSTISLSHLLDQVVKPPLPLQERRERGKMCSLVVLEITDPFYLPLKRGGPVCLHLERL